MSNVDTQKTIARANQVYAAAGITTADEGITVVPNTLPQYQKALVNGNLTLRVAMHPAALYGGPALYGNVNREAMGWNTSRPTPRTSSFSTAVPRSGPART